MERQRNGTGTEVEAERKGIMGADEKPLPPSATDVPAESQARQTPAKSNSRPYKLKPLNGYGGLIVRNLFAHKYYGLHASASAQEFSNAFSLLTPDQLENLEAIKRSYCREKGKSTQAPETQVPDTQAPGTQTQL
ncbi:hypothetical protein BOTBODRAFT_178052 [Botryobasidium botryosum FD-172 SS1]|uniref:Uncharacterized protein n=1 Tax=Botryobasidium botryosum (strain FD-172 SS1) TaxID=930990 RepID=A0A067MG62_BOTB1|nr:hypothetical protein BOTBODRAFT_178052 [Botryobasidium botryosum FD-172 SS1]